MSMSYLHCKQININNFHSKIDPRLSIHNLPTYPLLPASTDSRRLEEIRRTVVAINLDPTVIYFNISF